MGKKSNDTGQDIKPLIPDKIINMLQADISPLHFALGIVHLILELVNRLGRRLR